MLRVSPSTLLIGALSAFAFLQEAAGVSQSAHRFLASSFLSSEPEPSCKRWDMAFGELANLAALCENKKIVFVKNGEEKEGRHLPDKEEVLQDLAKKIANHHQKDRPWTKLGPDSTRPFFYASSIVSILELAGEEGGLGGDAETAWIKKALTESRGGLSIFDRDKWNALRHACGYGDVRPSLKPPSGFIALRAERALRGHGHTQLPPSLSLFESSETDFTDGDSSSFLQESGVEKDIKEAIAAGEAITEATKPSPPSSPSSASGKLQLLPFVEKGCVYNNVRYSGPGACPADVITSCMSTSPFVGSHCAGGFVCMEIEAQDKQEREATATAEASGKKPPSSSPASEPPPKPPTLSRVPNFAVHGMGSSLVPMLPCGRCAQIFAGWNSIVSLMVPHLVRRKVLDPNFQLPALSASASAFLNPPAEGERGGVQAAKGNKLDLERVSEGLAVELFQSAISSGAALADSVERAHVGDFASHLLSKSAKTLEVLNPTDLPPEVSNREIVFHLLLFGCVVMKGGHVRAEFLGPGQCPPDIACNCLRGHEMAHDRADAHLTATPMCSKLQYQCLVATPESLDRPFHEVRLPEKEEEEELINDGGR